MATFAKEAKTPQALLNKLIAQNLVVPDSALALQYITYVGHYRLKGYWFHLTDPATKQFKPGTTFDVIKTRYEFDREIRALILEAVERLEVAVRNTICNHLSLMPCAGEIVRIGLFPAGCNARRKLRRVVIPRKQFATRQCARWE